MNSNKPHYNRFVDQQLRQLPALADRKNPMLAGIIGFLFGPVGIGIYFKSKNDFLWCLGLLIGFMIVVPGVGLLPGWLFSAGYGYKRASRSNTKLGP